MKQDTIIQLLLVNQSENNAVEFTNILRNNGLALNPKIVPDAEMFSIEVSKKSYDIILLTENISDFNILTARKLLTKHQRDAVFILVGNKTPDETIALINQGISIVIPEELISLTIKREFIALKGLRSERILSQRLEDAENRCQQLIDNSRDAIAYIHEGMHTLFNNSYYQLFGYDSRDDIEAMTIMDLVSASDSKKLKKLLRNYSKSIKSTKSQISSWKEKKLQVNALKNDGSEFQIQMEFHPVIISGENCIQVIIHNNDLQQNNQQPFAQQQELSEPTIPNTQCQETGLYNRRYFLEYLKRTVKNTIDTKEASYLFYITLDQFAAIKEKLGIINSDQVIADIAHLMQNVIDKDNLLAHFESYIFTAIITTPDKKYTLELAEKIRKIVDDHIADTKNRSISITCSIGILEINQTNNDVKDILNQAQKACENAIRSGGNQIYLHVPDASKMDSQQQLIEFWINEIERAIKQKRLFLVFQPFVNLLNEGSENYETYIRLRNEQGEVVFPKEFLPPLESSGYSLNLDRWIVAETMRTLSESVKSGHNKRFIIKLTNASLRDKNFITWVKHNLKRYKLNGKGIIFQIKTHQAEEHLSQTQQLVKELHLLGCQFSLGNFGTESNAFKLLKHINVDFLKLDFDLVKNITSDTSKLKNLTTICNQANDQKLQTIVPYVEEACSLSVIWQSGAHFIQGMFLQEANESMDFDFSNFA